MSLVEYVEMNLSSWNCTSIAAEAERMIIGLGISKELVLVMREAFLVIEGVRVMELL